MAVRPAGSDLCANRHRQGSEKLNTVRKALNELEQSDPLVLILACQKIAQLIQLGFFVIRTDQL